MTGHGGRDSAGLGGRGSGGNAHWLAAARDHVVVLVPVCGGSLGAAAGLGPGRNLDSPAGAAEEAAASPGQAVQSEGLGPRRVPAAASAYY